MSKYKYWKPENPIEDIELARARQKQTSPGKDKLTDNEVKLLAKDDLRNGGPKHGVPEENPQLYIDTTQKEIKRVKEDPATIDDLLKKQKEWIEKHPVQQDSGKNEPGQGDGRPGAPISTPDLTQDEDEFSDIEAGAYRVLDQDWREKHNEPAPWVIPGSGPGIDPNPLTGQRPGPSIDPIFKEPTDKTDPRVDPSRIHDDDDYVFPEPDVPHRRPSPMFPDDEKAPGPGKSKGDFQPDIPEEIAGENDDPTFDEDEDEDEE